MAEFVTLPREFWETKKGEQVAKQLYGSLDTPAYQSALEIGTSISTPHARELGIPLDPTGKLISTGIDLGLGEGATMNKYWKDLIESGVIPEGISTSFSAADAFAETMRTAGIWGGEMVTAEGGRALTPDELLAQATKREKERVEREQEARRVREQERTEAERVLISSQFARLIGEAQEMGQREVSMARAQLTRLSGGLGIDTATEGAIRTVASGAEARIGELQRRRDEAMARQDILAAQRMDAIVNQESEELNKLYQDAWKFKLDLAGLISEAQKTNLAKIQMDWNFISKLGKDEVWTSPITGTTYTGLKEKEPFFKSSDLISLMKSMTIGQTQEITDPITGDVWTISGLAQPELNTQIFESEDRGGRVTYTIFDKNTGEVINTIDAGYIGKGFKGEGTTSDLEFKFTSADVQRLVVAGFDIPTINSIQDDLQTYSWEEVKKGISEATDEQLNILEQVMGAKAGEETITQESIENAFSNEQLMNWAEMQDKKRFIETGGGFWKKNVLKGDEFINYLLEKVKLYISQGLTTKEIWKKLNDSMESAQ